MKQLLRRFDVYCGNVFRSNYKLMPVMQNEVHTIVIRPNNAKFDKYSIYSSKPTQVTDKSYFDDYNTYIGKVLLIGDILK